MKYRLVLLAVIFATFAGSLGAQWRLRGAAPQDVRRDRPCQRIVSLAPSITESLFALGVGDRVVGVSRDSHYPPRVEEIKKAGDVGGYYDPNFEAIVRLKPDLVVMLEELQQSEPGVAKLGLPTLAVCHKTVDGIMDSFATIGRACGKEVEGERMRGDFRDRLARIQSRTSRLPRPRVLIALDRVFGCGHLADVYVAGVDDYFDKIIELAGGQNVYQRRGVRYPVLSPEGILRLNPEVIVDLVPAEKLRRFGRKTILGDWNDVGAVAAVKSHRLVIFAEDYALVPGPRFIRLVEELSRTLHPEVDTKRS